MNPNSLKLVYRAIIVWVVFSAQTVFCQTSDSAVTSQEQTSNAYIQSAGFGVLNTVGDISQYRNSLSIATFYAVRFSKSIEVATSLTFSEYAISQTGYLYNLNISTVIPTITQYSSFTHSLTGDISLILSPFTEDNWQRLRLHIGASVRRAGRISGHNGISLDSSRVYSVTTYTKQVALGGHVAVEYLLPIGNSLDIGLRLQSHAYLPPFWVEGSNVLLEYTTAPGASRYGFFPNGGDVSLGAFLRVSF